MPYEGLIAKGGQWNGQIELVHSKLREPFHWRKSRRVFVNSMSDLFHEKVPFDFISDMFLVMAQCPQHIFQILTKRADIMLDHFESDLIENHVRSCLSIIDDANTPPLQWPLPNVWLGVSVENLAAADERLPDLLRTPAEVHWASVEPLLGSVDLREYLNTDVWALSENPMNHTLDWVVVGGESGPGARPMELGWARTVRDHCQDACTPFFFKQWGEFAPNFFTNTNGQYNGGPIWMDRMGKKAAGRLLDGVEWNEYPIRMESQ
jgi:protein gp37